MVVLGGEGDAWREVEDTVEAYLKRTGLLSLFNSSTSLR